MKSLKNNIYFLKYVLNFSKSYLIAQALVAIINGLRPLITIIMPRLIIDEIMVSQDFMRVVLYVIAYSVLQLVSSIAINFLTERYINLNGHLYAMNFLLLINKKIVSLDMAQLDLPETHQKVALAQDIIYRGIGMSLINNFFNAITSVITIMTTIVIVMMADTKLIYVIVLFSIVAVYLNLRVENWHIAQRDENVYLSRVLNYYIRIMEDKICAKEMRMYGFTDWLMKKYSITLVGLRKRLKKLYSVSMNIKIISTISENIKSNGIYLYLGWLTFIKKITVGEFTQYFSATNQLSGGILTFVGFLTQLNINSKYIESFKEFMELDSNINVKNQKLIAENNLKEVSLEKENPIIKVENVCFKYAGGTKNVLENINYTFEYGKVYVIVGENGAGKSTLINLLSGLYEPTEGNIYLNDVPIDQIDYRDYRKKFSIVFQEFQPFAFTIAENVALGQYKEDEEVTMKIYKYLNEVGLGKKIEGLDKGIDTYLDKIFYEDGINLSGGENQKLALARALFREQKIVILDEPSSALDPISEDELLNSFKKLAEDKMIIYISHRLTCASTADEIIFIKNNTIYEAGTHQELMNLNGEYARYYMTQAKHYTLSQIHNKEEVS